MGPCKAQLGERIQNVLGVGSAPCSVGNRCGDSLRIFIVGAIIEQSAVLGLPDAAPLLEEKRNTMLATLIADGDNPFSEHRPGPRPALTANNRPTDARQIERAQ